MRLRGRMRRLSGERLLNLYHPMHCGDACSRALRLRLGPRIKRAMTADVSFAAALIAGLLSFLSPCVLPLVPPYLVYLAGASLERLADGEPPPRVRRDTVIAALLFVCGVLDGVYRVRRQRQRDRAPRARLFAATRDRRRASPSSSWACIFWGSRALRVLMREKRAPMSKPVGLWGAYVMGLAFAFGWTPCIGPILAAILAVAASRGGGGAGRGPAGGLLGRARHSVPDRGILRSSRRWPRSRGFAAHRRSLRRSWARCWCSPASAFLTGWVKRSGVLASGDVPGAGEDRVGSFACCASPRRRVTSSPANGLDVRRSREGATKGGTTQSPRR